MTLPNSIPTIYTPEVNLEKFFGFTCCFHYGTYHNDIYTTAVVKYIKRSKASL